MDELDPSDLSLKPDASTRPCCLHPWSFRDVEIPNNTQDIFRLLKSLQVPEFGDW